MFKQEGTYCGETFSFCHGKISRKQYDKKANNPSTHIVGCNIKNIADDVNTLVAEQITLSGKDKVQMFLTLPCGELSRFYFSSEIHNYFCEQLMIKAVHKDLFVIFLNVGRLNKNRWWNC